MSVRVARVCCFVAVLFVARMVVAQEGHPLTGTWYGDWGPSPTQRTQITVVLNWDGKQITGTMDPGPDAVPVKATLDSTNWTVHLEGDAKEKSGGTVHIAADGKLADIGSYNRTLTGTWTRGTTKGDFKLKRD